MSKYLDLTGLTYFLGKLKTYIRNAWVAKADTSYGLYWGAVDGTSTATTFTATISGITSYYEGLTVILANGVVASTTNCTLNINSLGALPIYPSTSTTRVSSQWAKAYTMIFVYTANKISGTPCWEMQYGMAYSNTIGYQLRTNSQQLAVSDKCYRYRLLFTSKDGTKYVPANTSTSTNATSSRTTNTTPIDPFGEIFYYGSTTALSAGGKPAVTILWQQYVVTLGYSFNNTGSALVLTADAPVYLKCTPQNDGSAVMDYYTQALPSTADGKIYIFLGVAVTETTIELAMKHPVYHYANGAIRPWTNPNYPVTSVNGQTGDVTVSGSLPAVTGADDGKVLMVSSGAWSVESLPTYNGGVS